MNTCVDCKQEHRRVIYGGGRCPECLDRLRLDRSITREEAAQIEIDSDQTWWRLVDDYERQEAELDSLIEEMLDEAFCYTDGTMEPNPLPDVLELVVGTHLTIDVREILVERWFDCGVDDIQFDSDLMAAAQAAVDAAAESASMWCEGETYYVDIRPLHADAIAKFMEGC